MEKAVGLTIILAMKLTDRHYAYEFMPLLQAFCLGVFASVISAKNVRGQSALDEKPESKSSSGPATEKKRSPKELGELEKALSEFRIQMGQAGSGGNPPTAS